MLNAGDLAVTQAGQLKDALDALAGDEFVMGDHHLSLLVLTDPLSRYDKAEVSAQQKILNDRVGSRAECSRKPIWAWRVRISRSRPPFGASFRVFSAGGFERPPSPAANFAAMAPFHNFPVGRARGNLGGRPHPLITSARSPFFLTARLRPQDPDGGSRAMSATPFSVARRAGARP